MRLSMIRLLLLVLNGTRLLIGFVLDMKVSIIQVIGVTLIGSVQGWASTSTIITRSRPIVFS